jgi:hypothetical protein
VRPGARPRLLVEALEERLCPDTVPLGVVQAGDRITVTATLHSSDTNENGEGEPLHITVLGNSGLSNGPLAETTLNRYEAPLVANFLVSQGVRNLEVDASIFGADGDENIVSFTAKVTTNKKDPLSQEQRDRLTALALKIFSAVNVAQAQERDLEKNLPSDPVKRQIDQLHINAIYRFIADQSVVANEYSRLATADPPDPNFLVIAQPVDAPVQQVTAGPGVTPAEAAAFNALFANDGHAIGLVDATITAINRASGASAAGDVAHETQQLQAARGFLSQLSPVAGLQPALRTGLQQALQSGGFPAFSATPADITGLETDVSQNGLPASLTQALQQVGADSATIDDIRRQVIVQDANAAAGSFPANLTDPGLVAALQGVSQVLKPKADTAGVFDPGTGTFFLRDGNSGGAPDVAPFAFGAPGWVPLAGDWTGSGATTVAVVDPATATWYIRASDSGGAPDVTPFQFGLPGWVPVAGDWTGTGHTGIGMVDPATGTWYLRNSPGGGSPDVTPFQFGLPGWVPVAGDWTGTGHTGIGAFNPATATWYLRDSAGGGSPDITPFAYGAPGWRPVAGDWTGAGHAGVGVFNPAAATWYLRNSTGGGFPDSTPFAYGLGAWTPLAGHWQVPPAAQLAEGEGPGATALGAGQLQATVSAALARLSAAGVDPALVQRLGSARFQVGSLPAGTLGLAFVDANRVVVSADAAGYGWFVDPTPRQDEEFAGGVAPPGSPAAGREDLLTVVLHEMGHLAGRPDVEGAAAGNDLMADALAPGVRRTQALDAVFSGAAP